MGLFQAMGLPGASKRRTREIGRAVFLNSYNNQPKDGVRDGWGVLERVRDRGGKRGRGRFIIVWGNGINDRKNRKLIMSWP